MRLDRLAGAPARLLARTVASVPPADPFGPVDQDPDQVRDAACRLVAGKQVCDPPTPPDVDPPNLPAWVATLIELAILLVFAALVVALIVLVVRALRGTRRRGRRRRRGGDGDDDGIEVLGDVQVDTSREPADWRREADDHRRAGRWRDALRCRYRALVGDLARAGLIDEIPGRTTGEERAQLAVVLPEASAPFDDAAWLFDDTWYGDRDADDRDVARMEQLEQQVLTVVAARRVGRRRTDGSSEPLVSA